MLYLVPTPIGNLGDMTRRAIEVLDQVDIILAEDTRKTGFLLKHFQVSTPMQSFHAHNEHRNLEGVIQKLQDGIDMALVSDAGTPSISDPGFLLVRACHEHNVPISCLPGPSAAIAALAMSGLPADRFFFEGFLPHKKGRQTRWKFLSTLQETIIVYESPHRIIKCLKEIQTHFNPEHMVAVIKEISKIHESIYRGTIQDVLQTLESSVSIKGEFVIIISK